MAYPVLPCVPVAAPYGAVERPPLAPVHRQPPDHDQRVRQAEQPLPSPVCHSLLHKGPHSVGIEGPRGAVRLAGEAVRLLVCADGDTIVVVLGHCRSEGWRNGQRSILQSSGPTQCSGLLRENRELAWPSSSEVWASGQGLIPPISLNITARDISTLYELSRMVTSLSHANTVKLKWSV